MVKISRNAPCPCGSGKKYKRCCLPDASPATLPTTASPRSDRPVPPVSYGSRWVITDLDALSNSVVDLIKKNKVDEAEKACERLVGDYPDCVDGIMRFIEVHKARENYALAADYAGKTAAFMRERKNEFDPESIEDYEKQERDLKQRAAERKEGA